MYKKNYLLFFSLVFIFLFNYCSNGADEWHERVPELKRNQSNDKRTEGLFLQDIKEFNINNNTFEEKDFDLMFVRHNKQEASHGMHCGQIRLNDKYNSCIGTGTIINVKRNSDIFEVIGISALHVFVDEKIDHLTGEKVYYLEQDRLFYQDTRNHGSGVNSLKRFKIEDVFIQENITKDFCLFKGRYSVSDIKSDIQKDSFYSFVTLSLPLIISEKELKELKGKKLNDCFMIHHPYGVKEQRINSGYIILPSDDSSEGSHWIRSLEGSSGASIVFKDISKIVAVHTSGDVMLDDEKNPVSIKYKENGEDEIDCNLVNNNIFVTISYEEILSIIQVGKSLYSVTKEFLNSTISNFIESKKVLYNKKESMG